MDAKNHKAYVSTGHLPPQQEIEELVEEAYERFKSNTDGKNSQVYPALAKVPSELCSASAWSEPAATSMRSGTRTTSSRS